MNVLAVDIGNTSTTVALVRRGRVGTMRRLPSRTSRPADIRAVLRTTLGRSPCDGAILASVVPHQNRSWLPALRALTGRPPMVLTTRLDLGVRVDYPRPTTIGADRLANAAGALVRHGAPVIVADFGTALTFDIVSPAGAYIGGVIAPGLPLMTDYLAERTALLPRVRLTGPTGVVGRSTREAMRIGARVGYRGMVREILNHLRAGLNVPDLKLSATGGYARWALEGSGLPFAIDPDLTLFGLATIFERNRPRAAGGRT